MHQLSKPLSPRVTIATLIFVLGCLLSTVRILRDAPIPGHVHTDDVAKNSDQRFAALKAALPSHGVVGYVGESGNPIADYYLAQYALAPLVIDRSPNHPLVIGNFPASPPPSPSDHLQLLTDFGNGVLLFANKDAK
jgi:hypothetical protein